MHVHIPGQRTDQMLETALDLAQNGYMAKLLDNSVLADSFDAHEHTDMSICSYSMGSNKNI